jgi:hypothetical protein
LLTRQLAVDPCMRAVAAKLSLPKLFILCDSTTSFSRTIVRVAGLEAG